MPRAPRESPPGDFVLLASDLLRGPLPLPILVWEGKGAGAPRLKVQAPRLLSGGFLRCAPIYLRGGGSVLSSHSDELEHEQGAEHDGREDADAHQVFLHVRVHHFVFLQVHRRQMGCSSSRVSGPGDAPGTAGGSGTSRPFRRLRGGALFPRLGRSGRLRTPGSIRCLSGSGFLPLFPHLSLLRTRFRPNVGPLYPPHGVPVKRAEANL